MTYLERYITKKNIARDLLDEPEFSYIPNKEECDKLSELIEKDLEPENLTSGYSLTEEEIYEKCVRISKAKIELLCIKSIKDKLC
ncbi:hypothetical protein PBI_SCTP2_367 [Salicola phage SCTP-2]|nr:hypothetical protein PBI_SCTP2_367 [Salicola phage SCTP-2]